MLEDELLKVWRLMPEACPDNLGTIEMARHEYTIYIGTCPFRTLRTLDVRETMCEATATLVKANLIEALSSPNAYIREWGKLIMEEQECLKTNLNQSGATKATPIGVRG